MRGAAGPLPPLLPVLEQDATARYLALWVHQAWQLVRGHTAHRNVHRRGTQIHKMRSATSQNLLAEHLPLYDLFFLMNCF